MVSSLAKWFATSRTGIRMPVNVAIERARFLIGIRPIRSLGRLRFCIFGMGASAVLELIGRPLQFQAAREIPARLRRSMPSRYPAFAGWTRLYNTQRQKIERFRATVAIEIIEPPATLDRLAVVAGSFSLPQKPLRR